MILASDRQKRRGFTLTELAIVLGVMGIVLGGIWVAASKVYQNNRVQTAVKDTEIIVQGYRSLYTGHSVDTNDWTDITCLGVNSGFYPNDMLLANTLCVNQNSATYPQHPWNGYVVTYTVKSWQAITVDFANLPQQACNQLAQQIGNAPDIIYEYLNGTDTYMPPLGTGVPLTELQISNLCAANNTNYLRLAFKVH